MAETASCHAGAGAVARAPKRRAVKAGRFAARKRCRSDAETTAQGEVPESILAVLSWLRSEGALVDGVRVERGPAGCRIVASRDLPAGFVFFRLPVACALTPAACLQSALGQAIAKHCRIVTPEAPEETGSDEVGVTQRSVLYAFLMTADDRRFGPYLEHLRGSVKANVPHEWSAEDRARLPADVLEDIDRYEPHILGQFAALLPRLSEAEPELFPPDRCSRQHWAWAHGAYTSRTFPWEGGDADDGMLVPFLDCLNHDSESANVEWLGAGLEEARGARVAYPVLAGEELLYSYGCKGNAQLVLGYGFAIWENPHELVSLKFDLTSAVAPDGPDWSARLEKFDRVLAEHDGAEPAGAGAAVVYLRLEDFDEGLPNMLLDLAAAVSDEGEGAREVLKKLLLQAGKEAMQQGGRSLSGPAWQKYERQVRRRDSVRVGSHRCAGSPEGCAVALRSSRMQVIVAALDVLECQ